MSDNNETDAVRSGCGPRLVWLAKAVFTLLLVIGALVAVAWGGFMIYQIVQGEINRSADSVATRFDAQESRIDVLRREVNDLVAANPGQEEQLNQLNQDLAAVSSQVAELDAALTEQNAAVATLTASMSVTLDNDAAAAADIVALNDGLAALQADLNSAGGRIDAIGGEVDGLSGDVGVLSDDVAQVAATAVSAQDQAAASETAVTDMSQTLMLFRAWELVARARLRLLENNPGLAQTDIENADDMVQRLIPLLPADAPRVDRLTVVQTRLALAADNLEANPDLAGADLENAWDELDQILTARLQPAIEALPLGLGAELDTPVPEDVAAEETPTPAPTLDPTPTATPAAGG